MSDQAQRLREHVEKTGRADGTYRDARGNIIRDFAPARPETAEDYQNRLAWYRVSELMHNKKGGES